jgi:hypothetical protein
VATWNSSSNDDGFNPDGAVRGGIPMTEHLTHDTLINRFLDARWLLHETGAELTELVQTPGASPDAETLRDLYQEIDEYLGNEAREAEHA